MKTTPTAHDALFKQFLTHPEAARDFLDVHLPPALRQVGPNYIGMWVIFTSVLTLINEVF